MLFTIYSPTYSHLIHNNWVFSGYPLFYWKGIQVACSIRSSVMERKRYGEMRSARMMRINRDREPKTTDSKLMAKLYEAEEESANADIEVQVLQETLDTYRMLK
jgi:hypothetical protein